MRSDAAGRRRSCDVALFECKRGPFLTSRRRESRSVARLPKTEASDRHLRGQVSRVCSNSAPRSDFPRTPGENGPRISINECPGTSVIRHARNAEIAACRVVVLCGRTAIRRLSPLIKIASAEAVAGGTRERVLLVFVRIQPYYRIMRN